MTTALSPQLVYGGIPHSDTKQPDPVEVIRLLNSHEAAIGAGLGGLVAFADKATMDADLAHDAGTIALVYGDATVANNTYYSKSGASGAGAWSARSEIAERYIVLSNAGAGTANAIQMTSTLALPAGAYAGKFLGHIVEDNEAGAITISVNGAAAKPVVDNGGTALTGAGLLTAGMALEFVDDGTSYRLTSDIASSAIQTAAEAWAEGTEPGGPGTKSAKEWANTFGNLVGAIEDAEAARDKAEEWADADEDVEVEAGQYSAKHQRIKAEAARVGAEDAEDGAVAALSSVDSAKAVAQAAAASVGAYSDATLAAALTTALAGTSEGDTFYATGADVAYAGLYRHDSGPLATELGRLIFGDSSYTPLSSYAYALVDAANRVAIGVLPSGEVVLPGTATFNAIQDQVTALSDVAWGVTDQDGRLALAVLLNGNVEHKGVEVDISQLTALQATLQNALDPELTVDCWGDSITHGNASGVTTPYPTALAALLTDRTVNNKGLSGLTSLQAATRMGAVPSLLTVTDNTIPASGAVTVTVTENGNFSSKTDFSSISVTGTLFGIHGTLQVAFNSSNPELPGTTTFTRTEAGDETLIPAYAPFIPDTGDWENNTVVIWVGRNDVISFKSGETDYDNDFILTNIQAMVDFLEPLRRRFIVLTVTDSLSEYAAASSPDSEAFAQIQALNKEIVRRWPRNSIDIRKILVNNYDSGEPDDVTAFGRDQVPPTLHTADGLHINDAGLAIVAQAVDEFITMKGW